MAYVSNGSFSIESIFNRHEESSSTRRKDEEERKRASVAIGRRITSNEQPSNKPAGDFSLAGAYARREKERIERESGGDRNDRSGMTLPSKKVGNISHIASNVQPNYPSSAPISKELELENLEELYSYTPKTKIGDTARAYSRLTSYGTKSYQENPLTSSLKSDSLRSFGNTGGALETTRIAPYNLQERKEGELPAWQGGKTEYLSPYANPQIKEVHRKNEIDKRVVEEWAKRKNQTFSLNTIGSIAANVLPAVNPILNFAAGTAISNAGDIIDFFKEAKFDDLDKNEKEYAKQLYKALDEKVEKANDDSVGDALSIGKYLPVPGAGMIFSSISHNRGMNKALEEASTHSLGIRKYLDDSNAKHKERIQREWESEVYRNDTPTNSILLNMALRNKEPENNNQETEYAIPSLENLWDKMGGNDLFKLTEPKLNFSLELEDEYAYEDQYSEYGDYSTFYKIPSISNLWNISVEGHDYSKYQ